MKDCEETPFMYRFHSWRQDGSVRSSSLLSYRSRNISGLTLVAMIYRRIVGREDLQYDI